MLENLDVALAELVGKVETLSPQLWRIARREVWVNLFSSCIWFFISILLLIMGISCLIILYKKYKRDQNEEDNYEISEETFVALLFCGLIGCIVGMPMFFNFAYEIGRILINPEYRALEIIMELIK